MIHELLLFFILVQICEACKCTGILSCSLSFHLVVLNTNVSKMSCAVPPLQVGMSRMRVCAIMVSKIRTRTARRLSVWRLSVLQSVLSSIIIEYGPLWQQVITRAVTSNKNKHNIVSDYKIRTLVV